MANVGELVVQITGENSGINSAMSGAKKSLIGLSAPAALAAAAVAAVGIALINIAKESIAVGMEFDKTMSQVAAITNATGESFIELRENAKLLGSETVFSATQAAEGMKFLGMAGFSTNEIIEAMPGLLSLASASGTELAATADIVSDAMTGFGLSADETGKFADILAVASSKANTNVLMLGESFKFVAPIAGALNFTVEETTAALGVMANSGIKASQAGTTLRTIMTELAKSAGDSESKFADLNIEVSDAEGNMASFQDIVNQSKEAFSGMSDAQKASTAEALVGKIAMTGFLTLVNDTSGELDTLTTELESSEGAAQKMADTMVDNLAGDVTLAKSAMEGIGIAINDVLTPSLRGFMSLVLDGMPTVKNILVTTFEGVVVVVNFLIDIFKRYLLPVIKQIFDDVSTLIPPILNIFKLAFGPIIDLVIGTAKAIDSFLVSIGAIEAKAKVGSASVNIYSDRMLDFKESMIDAKDASGKLTVSSEAVATAITKTGEATKKATGSIKKSYEELNKVGDALTKAIQNQYKAQAAAVNSNLDRIINKQVKATEKIISQLDKEFSARVRNINLAASEEEKALQEQIQAIDDLTSKEDEEARKRSHITEVGELEKQLAMEMSAEERLKLQEEINELLAEEDRRLLLIQREQQKEALENEITAIRSQAELKIKEAEKEYNNARTQEEKELKAKLDWFEEVRESTTKHLDKLASEEEAAAKAREMLVNNSNQEIINILGTYNDKWLDAGKTFGEKFTEGLTTALKKAKQAMSEFSSNAGKEGGPAGISYTGTDPKTGKTISTSSKERSKELTGVSVRGAKANGGPITAGQPYLVGERGPEIITPNSSGMVTPNNKIGNGSATNNITINITSNDPDSIFDELVRRLNRQGVFA